jgi:hypothetical protein
MKRIKFKVATLYGDVEAEGYSFDWNGIEFVLHRQIMWHGFSRWGWGVSHVETGRGISPKYLPGEHPHYTEMNDKQTMIDNAIAWLEFQGLDKLHGAIEKAKLSKEYTK